MKEKTKPYYPIFLDLKGKKALVVGGGEVAQRKIETLLEHGAEVRVLSRELTPVLTSLWEADQISYQEKPFIENDLEGVFLVIAATDDPALNRRVSRAAMDRNLLINAVDQPADCNFILPSILRRGDLAIAVSTSGRSPAMAKKVRRFLEGHFGPEYGIFLRLMGHLRKDVLSRGRGQKENSRLFAQLVDSELLGAIRQKAWEKVAHIINDILKTRFSAEDVRSLCNS